MWNIRLEKELSASFSTFHAAFETSVRFTTISSVMKPAAVQSSFLVRWLCCIGGGLLALKSLGKHRHYMMNNLFL